MIWVVFLLTIGAILYAGVHLTRYGDMVAEKLGISSSLVGFILLAIITSLPELVTSLAATIFQGAPNLAIGNVAGSNLFNLTIIAVMDLFLKTGVVFTEADRGHIRVGWWGMVLMAIALVEVVGGFNLPIWHVGVPSILIFLIYLIGIRAVFRVERHLHREQSDEEKRSLSYEHISPGKVYGGFLLFAAIIVVGGTLLSWTGDQIAQITGWGRTFVGSLFLAAATSLPELVVSLSALRLGLAGMAFGNVLGSNMANMLIIFFADLAYPNGSILTTVSRTHGLTLAAGILLTLFVIFSIKNPAKVKFFRLSWQSLVIVVVYVISFYFIFIFK